MGKVFITGSTRGLGRCLCGAFARSGYDAIMNGRHSIDTLFEAMWKDASEISVSDLASLGVGIVINNAFDKENSVQSGDAQLRVLRTAVDYFQKRGCGVIVNINSVAAINDEYTDYAISKKDLREYSLSIKKDANEHGITIIDVYPGAIKTEWTKGRPDWNNLIDPQELASFIVDLVKPSSFYVDEVIVRRPKC